MKIFIFLMLSISVLFSAPAFSKLREFHNSDGTSFMAKARGNHLLHWIQTADGEILKYNASTKDFEYAKIKDTTLKASGVRYNKNNSKRARSLGHINKVFLQDLQRLWQLKHKEASKRKK